MSDHGPDRDDDADARLTDLQRAKNDAITRCHYRTAVRLAGELKRTAKAARRLEPYVWALHTLMNNAPALLEPEAGQEAAVELIAVLESEDRARQIQPDVEPSAYEWLVSRVSSCAYDGLGRSMALARGYNSDGVHETVAEGIQVCRRTGKLECVNCFREYASDVLRASDDLEMALHHARQVVLHGNVNQAFDRRWCGASEEVSLLVLGGRIDAAEVALARAEGFVATHHNPIAARLETDLVRELIHLLTGRDGGVDAPLDPEAPSFDESPEHHLYRDLNSTLRASLRGDHAAAIATLTTWDRRLSERQCLTKWFEVRLRLVAAHRLAGAGDRAAGLIRQLESKARDSRDWLTLRRLALLLDPSVPDSPIAPASPLRFGPSTPPPTTEAILSEPDQAEPAVPTPLSEAIEAVVAECIDATDAAEGRTRALDRLLGFGPDRATDPTDVAQILHLARQLAIPAADTPPTPEHSLSVWSLAETIAAPFPHDAVVLSLLATLGDMLRNFADDPAVAAAIDPNRLEGLVRSSLDLDQDNQDNFGRAARLHANAGRLNEAERCLARVLRLDRADVWAALALADIYRRSDRANDALVVLDMALRAGAYDGEVAWQAVGLAHSLGQNEALLTYLDRLDELQPDRPWASYYRASGLLRLGRADEALVACDDEERRNRADLLNVTVLRA